MILSLSYDHSCIMPPQAPSIQSFFQPEVPSSSSHKPYKRTAGKMDTNDGFTSSEVEATLHPSLHKWQPRAIYTAVDIGSLVPGPGCVTLVGRIVNFYDQTMNSKSPQAAKGCLKVIVKDDTGAFTVYIYPICRRRSQHSCMPRTDHRD